MLNNHNSRKKELFHYQKSSESLSYIVGVTAGLKGRAPGAIFTGGPLWRNSWRHPL